MLIRKYFMSKITKFRWNSNCSGECYIKGVFEDMGGISFYACRAGFFKDPARTKHVACLGSVRSLFWVAIAISPKRKI